MKICYLVEYKINGEVERIHIAALSIPDSIQILTSYLSTDVVFEVVSVVKCQLILV